MFEVNSTCLVDLPSLSAPSLNHCNSQALADKIPFADIHPEPQLIIALVQGKSPNDTKDLVTYPRQLGDLPAKCWSREPNQRPPAADCLNVVELTLPILEKKGSSGITELVRHPNSPSLPPLTGLAPSPTMADRAPNISTNFTSHSTQHHSSNNPQEQSRNLASSPQGGALLRQRAVNQARQAQELGQKSVSFWVLFCWPRFDCIGKQDKSLQIRLSGRLVHDKDNARDSSACW